MRNKRQLWPVVRKIHDRARKNVLTVLGEHYRELIAKRTTPDAEFGTFQACRYVRAQYAAQSIAAQRNQYDLDVAVAVREAEDGRILLIPYPGSGLFSLSLGFMKTMKELRDYHYQNSSDRPSHITQRTWAERARTWGPLLRDPAWHRFLTLDVVSLTSGIFEEATYRTLANKANGARKC
jgi:hypothetical protein